PVRLLPVLAAHRGRRRRPLPALLHVPAAGRGRGGGRRAPAGPREEGSAEAPGAGGDAPGARAAGHRPGHRRFHHPLPRPPAPPPRWGGGRPRLAAAALAARGARGVRATPRDRARLSAGYGLVDAALDAGLAKSKSEARRLITQGGLYVNNQPVADPNLVL